MHNRHFKAGARQVSAVASAVAVVVFALIAPASAQTWDGGAGGGNANNWNDNNNWNPNGAPAAGSTVSLVFTGAVRLTNTNNIGNLALSSWVFGTNAGAFVISGNAIRLTGGITNNSTNTQTIRLTTITNNITNTINAASNNIVLGSAVVGTGGLTKIGANTLTLTNNNSYSGTTAVGAGVLAVTNGLAISDSGTVSLSNISGATFLVSGSETIGSLQGGGTTGGNVSIASGQTLTVGRD